jgi:hypothetical protein
MKKCLTPASDLKLIDKMILQTKKHHNNQLHTDKTDR